MSASFYYNMITQSSCKTLIVAYPLLRHGSLDPLNFHFDDVQCIGNENTLSECAHLGLGIHNCVEGTEEAGVVCTSECIIFVNLLW